MASAPVTGIHSLPYETLSAIFSFLPIPDLARCAAVCEQWHDIVTGFTRLWEGKRYRSDRSPRESAEVYAVLRALPPLQEVVVKTGEFRIDVSYLSLSLSVRDVSDIGSAEDGPRLKCTSLSIGVEIVEAVLCSGWTIDLVTLGKLQIFKKMTRPTRYAFGRRRHPEVDNAIGCALELCPNLSYLCVFAPFLSENRLDTSEGISRLRVLDIECPGLKELTFLRRCSDVLEELELKHCVDLPSAAYAGLGQLGNLRRLRLCACRVAAGDLEVAVKGMRRLVSLHLDRCYLVSDLSCLRHCEQLQELHVEGSPPDAPLTGLCYLPAGLRSLHLEDVAVDADELSEAAARLLLLEELHLVGCELAHLRFLRRCSHLRRLSLEFSDWPDTSQLSNLRHLTRLEVLDLTGCRVDADVLSGALPSLTPRLHTLSLSRAEDVAHLQFLRHCPQICTLSLDGLTGLEKDAYRELCHLSNLQTLDVSGDVREFVREVVRPCVPKLNI